MDEKKLLKYAVDYLSKYDSSKNNLVSVLKRKILRLKITNFEKRKLIEIIESIIIKLEKNKFKADWAICAFEKEEFICLKEAIKLGGKIRIGFENSLYLPSGEIAQDNETKIKIIKEELNLN